MDIDGDGILSMYELEYFYSEQVSKMEALGIETMVFEDCLCQVSIVVTDTDMWQLDVCKFLTLVIYGSLIHQGVTIGRTQSMEKFHPLSFKFIFFFVLILFQILDMVKPKVEGTVGFLYRQCGICVAQ